MRAFSKLVTKELVAFAGLSIHSGITIAICITFESAVKFAKRVRRNLSDSFKQSGAFRIEIRPISGSSLSDLDLRRLTQYFAEIRQQATPDAHDQEAWNAFLVNTEILCQDRDLYPSTVAGQLLFGRTPNRFLPHAGIDAAAYSECPIAHGFDDIVKDGICCR